MTSCVSEKQQWHGISCISATLFFVTDLFDCSHKPSPDLQLIQKKRLSCSWWRWVAVLIRKRDHCQSAQQWTHTGHLFWQAEAEPALLSRESVHLGLQLVLVLLTCMRFIMCPGASIDPGWLNQGSPNALLWVKKGSPSFQYSTCFVSLYHSRDILFLALVVRCFFWVSLLTIFYQLPLYHVSGWVQLAIILQELYIFFCCCWIFSLKENEKACSLLERNWDIMIPSEELFSLCILKISHSPLTFYMHAN